MPVRIFSLRYVPDGKQLVPDLVTSEPGNWGISGGAFWLRSDEQLEEAKHLIADYQHSRGDRARAEYESLRSQGLQRKFTDVVRENPLRLIFYVAAIIFILYFSIKPFLAIGNE